MLYYFLKFVSAFFLAILIYFVGMQQGCSPVQYGNVGTLSCEEFPEGANCQVRPVVFSCEEKPDQAKCQPVAKPDLPRSPRPEKPEEHERVRERKPSPSPQHYCEISHELSLGKVDILFVIDNSSSMAKEHRDLASQFSSFLSDLRDVNYHIAVITTDISISPDNPVRNQRYQDGRFIPIGKRKFLRNENIGARPAPETVEDFKQAIERQETIRCDRRDYQAPADKWDRMYQKTEQARGCPSGDERGTYAVNMALENPAHRSFFRSDSHLMIVILSDEDVRSGEEFYSQSGNEIYQPELKDMPETLVENISRRSPSTKTLSFYPIIISPGDSACLTEQNRDRAGGAGSGRGYYGKKYARLALPDRELKEYGNILEGGVISICSKNYGSQLRRVAVSAQTSRVPLACSNPESLDLYVSGQKVRSEQKIEGRTLIISPRSEISLSSRLKVVEICPLKAGQKCEP